MRAAQPREVAHRECGSDPRGSPRADDAGNAELRFSRAGPEFTIEPGSAGQRIGYRLRDGDGRSALLAAPRPARRRRAVSVRARGRHRAASTPPISTRAAAGTTTGRCSARRPSRAPCASCSRWTTARSSSDGSRCDETSAVARLAAPRSCSRCCSRRSRPPSPSTVFADQQRWSRTVEHRRDQVQAQALALAGVQWARQILYDDAQRSAIDHLGEPWAVALAADSARQRRGSRGDRRRAGDGSTSTRSARRRERGRRADADRAAVRAAGRTVGRDSTRSPTGSTATASSANAAPRTRGTRAGHAAASPPTPPVLRVAELADVKGVTPASLAAVAPFLTALPAGTPVNVNTAPPEVLAADRRQALGRRPRAARRDARTETVHDRRRIRATPARRRDVDRRRHARRQERLLLRDDRGAAGRRPWRAPAPCSTAAAANGPTSCGRSSSSEPRRSRDA